MSTERLGRHNPRSSNIFFTPFAVPWESYISYGRFVNGVGSWTKTWLFTTRGLG